MERLTWQIRHGLVGRQTKCTSALAPLLGKAFHFSAPVPHLLVQSVDLCYTPWCWEERKRSWEQHRHREGHMPRVPLHALTWSREQNLYELYTQGQLQQRFRPAEEAAWLAWLGSVSSFAFHSPGGSLNVYLEKRPRGGAYWYAYHTSQNRTRKRYLGRTENLSL